MATVDRFAEAVVAGCCAASHHGAELAHQRINAGDFTIPALANIFTHSINVPVFPMPTDEQAAAWSAATLTGQQPATVWPGELRLQALAELTGIPLEEIAQLTGMRTVDADVTGLYATRVHAAALERQAQADTVELHELLRTAGDGDHQRAAQLAARIATNLAEVS